MRTEITPRAMKKSRLDRIAHYNMHMVLKIKEEDRGSYVYEARKAYGKCRNKKAKKKFLALRQKSRVNDGEVSCLSLSRR